MSYKVFVLYLYVHFALMSYKVPVLYLYVHFALVAGKILAFRVSNRVSTGIPGSGFQPRKTRKNHDFSGLENNAENPEITQKFPGSGFRGSNPEPRKISGFQPGTRKNFRVPTQNPEKFPGSNPEHGKISGFQPGTRKIFRIPTRN